MEPVFFLTVVTAGALRRLSPFFQTAVALIVTIKPGPPRFQRQNIGGIYAVIFGSEYYSVFKGRRSAS